MKPRLARCSLGGAGALSLRLAEAVSLQQEKQRFLFHSEPCCFRWLEGPPPPAALSWNARASAPPAALERSVRPPAAPGTPLQTLGPKLTRTPATGRCQGAGGPKPGGRVGALGSSQGEGPLRAQLLWARHGLASPGGVPESSAAHAASPRTGRVQSCEEHPGRAWPPGHRGWGRASGSPWRAEHLLSSQGAPGGPSETPAAECMGPGPHGALPLAEAHPRALTQTAAPGWYPSCGPLQTGDRASPVRKTENETSACWSGASPQPRDMGGAYEAAHLLTWASRAVALPPPPTQPYGTQSPLSTSPLHPC